MATAMMSSQGSQHSIDAKHAEFRPSFGGGFPLGADHVLDETASQPENIKDSPISPRGSSHGSFQSKDLEMSESKDDDDDDAQEAQPRDSSLDDQPPSGADAKELDMSCPTTSKNLLPLCEIKWIKSRFASKLAEMNGWDEANSEADRPAILDEIAGGPSVFEAALERFTGECATREEQNSALVLLLTIFVKGAIASLDDLESLATAEDVGARVGEWAIKPEDAAKVEEMLGFMASHVLLSGSGSVAKEGVSRVLDADLSKASAPPSAQVEAASAKEKAEEQGAAGKAATPEQPGAPKPAADAMQVEHAAGKAQETPCTPGEYKAINSAVKSASRKADSINERVANIQIKKRRLMDNASQVRSLEDKRREAEEALQKEMAAELAERAEVESAEAALAGAEKTLFAAKTKLNVGARARAMARSVAAEAAAQARKGREEVSQQKKELIALMETLQ